MFNCITNHFRKKKQETYKENIHPIKNHNLKPQKRYVDEDDTSDLESLNEYLGKKSKIIEAEVLVPDLTKVEHWLSSSQNKFSETLSESLYRSACYSDFKRKHKVLRNFEKPKLSRSCNKEGYFDCKRSKFESEFKSKNNIYNESSNRLKRENIYENIKNDHKYDQINHENFNSNKKHNFIKMEKTVPNIENINMATRNKESYLKNERDKNGNFFTKDDGSTIFKNQSLESSFSASSHIYSAKSMNKTHESIYKNIKSWRSQLSPENFTTYSSETLDAQHIRKSVKNNVADIQKVYNKKETSKKPQSKRINNLSENLTSLISSILESGYISDSSRNYTTIKKQFQIEIEVIEDTEASKSKRSPLNIIEMNVQKVGYNDETAESSACCGTPLHNEAQQNNVTNLILKITKLEGRKTEINVEKLKNTKSNKKTHISFRNNESPISILNISEIKSLEKPMNNLNNTSFIMPVVDSTKYENNVFDEAFCLCDHESLSRSKFQNTTSPCLIIDEDETIGVNRRNCNKESNTLATNRHANENISFNRFYCKSIINKYKKIRFYNYKYNLTKKKHQISKSFNLLDR